MGMGPTDVRYSPSTAAWPGLWWEHYSREEMLLPLLHFLAVILIYLTALNDNDKGNRK